jgi:two-component system phosphate regulon response regulator PhoB
MGATTTSQQNRTTAQTILVVEDEDSVAEVLITLLEAEGYKVLAARDGQDALARLKHEEPDLILTDVMLPKMDGIAMCRIIQQSPAYKGYKDIPVVLMSADGPFPGQQSCKIEAFVAKPFDLEVLLTLIERIMRSKFTKP